MRENVIVKTITRLIVPLIQLFALYVIMHGESGPGGGFQGGVILGSSIILFVIAFGAEEGRKRISEKANNFLISLGVIIYAGIGLLCILAGGNYLEYNILPLGTPQHASELGILGIEIGVGITVFAVMTSIFFNTAARSKG